MKTALKLLFALLVLSFAVWGVADVFTGKCRGIGFVEMEGHEARAAMAALNGKTFKDRALRVNQERPDARRGGRARR